MKKNKISFTQLKKIIRESILDDSSYAEQLSAFGVKTLVFSLIVHIWHINCTSGTDHDTLREFYYFLEDKADSLLEATIGRSNIPVAGQIAVDYGEFGDFSIEEIKKYREETAALENFVKTDVGCSNILADIVERCDSVIFKLTRLD